MWGNVVRCLTDGSQCEALGALSLVGCPLAVVFHSNDG